MSDCRYRKFWKRQNKSDRKQINEWQGLGVGGGELWGSEIFYFFIVVVVT